MTTATTDLTALLGEVENATVSYTEYARPSAHLTLCGGRWEARVNFVATETPVPA